MQVKIDYSSTVPIYHQIVRQVETQVEKGYLKSGDKLPTFRELSSGLGVSLGTVKNAYDELFHKGTIEMTQGRGSFVSSGAGQALTGKKDMALKVIDDAINQLLSIPISPQEARIFFDLKMRQLEHTKTAVKVAVVDCNIEALIMIENQLSKLEHIDINMFLLDKFMGIDENNLADVDLFVTTFTHIQEVEQKITNENKLMRIVVSTALETMLKLSKIVASDNVAVVTSSTKFSAIINKEYHKYISTTKSLNLYFLGDNLNIDKIIKEHNKIILPKSFYRIASSAELGLVKAAEENNVEIIYYNYDIDKGSFTYLKEKINELYDVLVVG